MAERRRHQVVDTLRQRFLSGSHLGLLKPGDKLPSARDVARELGVDRRVVLAAYHELEGEGVIELRQRSGIYFAPAARGAPADERRTDWVADVLLGGLQHGVPVPALADALHRWVGTLRLRAVAVECNDDQAATLCAELRDDYGLEATQLVIDPLSDDVDRLTSAPPPALARADILVTTPFHAGEVQTLGARVGKPWIAAALRADVFAELARRLDDGPAYAVVADPRFANKLRLIYGSTRGSRHFHALVAGLDDLARIPPDAPVYVTRLARERAGDALPSTIRQIPEPRAFSTPSARELLHFIVRSNIAVAGLGSASGGNSAR